MQQPQQLIAFIKRAEITVELSVSVINLKTRKVIYERNHNQSFAPASILKVITALSALETFGPNFRYSTRVLADGSIKNGHLSGGLYLVGSGDLMPNTNQLFALAEKVKAAALRYISSNVLYNEQKIDRISQIYPL